VSRFLAIFFILMNLGYGIAAAQNTYGYEPRKRYSEKSADLLIAQLKSMLAEEFLGFNIPSGERPIIKNIIDQRTDLLVKRVKWKSFIQDDSLETYVNNVLKKLIADNALPDRPRLLLIDASHEVNASCYGRGVFIVTLGLLARISTEGELAFTLAHEIAHDELNHVRSNILREAKINLAGKSKEQIIKILKGDIEPEEIEVFKKLVYGVSRHGRQKELDADSLGFVFFNTADYREKNALSTLDILETAKEPKYDFDAEIFMPLNDEAFPLQDDFFSKRLSIYSRKGESFLYSNDSLQSHPEMKVRKEALESYFTGYDNENRFLSASFVDAVTTLAEFETVESAYRNKDFDWCLYHALFMLRKFPNHPYLISRIGKVLIKLYETRKDNSGEFFVYVSQYTVYYGKVAKLINNMLHNLTTNELGEMAFYFLNNPDHFNENDKSHYYLLWRVSELTYRNDVRDEMRKAFKEKFKTNISAYTYP
jgi:predicted Zn-dependent protease